MSNEKSDFGPRLGADPEMFVQNMEGKPVPVCGKVGGTKEQPINVDKEIIYMFGRSRKDAEDVGNYAIQEDNVMLEVNIPASKSAVGFASSMQKMMSWLGSGFLAEKGLVLRLKTSHQSFSTDVLDQYPQASTIGCLPDMDAYAENGNWMRQPFQASDFGNNRFCGGHLHLQYNKENVPPHIMARFMDLVVGLPTLGYDKQNMRRQFYGKPGLFRIKDYGIEYRTLSNFWIRSDFIENRLQTMAESALNLGYLANNTPNILRDMFSKVKWDDVQEIISKENNKEANLMIADLRRSFPGVYIGVM